MIPAVSVYRIIKTNNSPPCGGQWVGKCDLYISAGAWKLQFVENFANLTGGNGYGVVIHRNKALIKDKLREFDWNKFGQTINGMYRINKHTIAMAAAS